jgi:hypothetical protein
VAHDVERVLADIDANHGNCSVQCLGHGVLLVLAPLASLSLAGREHGRTIPLAEVGLEEVRLVVSNSGHVVQRDSSLLLRTYNFRAEPT